MATLSGITTYTHDAAGNRTRVDPPDGTADTFAWDARSQMTAATVGGNAVTMTYNAFRQRVSKTTSGGTTLCHYDHKNLIHESEVVDGDDEKVLETIQAVRRPRREREAIVRAGWVKAARAALTRAVSVAGGERCGRGPGCGDDGAAVRGSGWIFGGGFPCARGFQSVDRLMAGGCVSGC